MITGAWAEYREKDLAKYGKAKSTRKKLWKIVEEAFENHCPDLWAGSNNFTVDDDIVAAIEKDFEEQIPRQIRKATDLLANVLASGKSRFQWKVKIPDHFHLLPNEKNLYTPATLEKNETFRTIERAFVASLEGLWNEKNDEEYAAAAPVERVGKILLSAILYGGIHQRRWIEPWLQGLIKGPHLWKDWLWLNLEIGESKSRQLSCWYSKRRWIADPVTHLLILNWKYHYPDDINQLELGSWQDILKKQLQKLDICISVDHLISATSAHSAVINPGFLVAYQSGTINSACLPEDAFIRFVSGEIPSFQNGNLNIESFDPPQRIRRQTVVCTSTDVEKSWRLVSTLLHYLKRRTGKPKATSKVQLRLNKKITKSAARKTVVKFIDRYGSELTPSALLLVEWAKRLFEMSTSDLERRAGYALAPSSVVTYTTTIGQALLEHAGLAELSGLKEADFEVLYEEVLSYPITSNQKIKTADRLAQFHGFLQTYIEDEEVPEIDFDEIKSCYGLPTKNVRANLITEAEYQAILKSFGWGKSNLDDWQRIHLVTLILAYRLGLRRGEIQGLTVSDIKTRVIAELRVRPGRFRDLKSISGNRRLPLRALVPEAELEFLLQWHKKRRADVKSREEALLYHYDAQGDLIPIDLLFDPIVKVVRATCHDDTLTIHSFRHSFASLLLLKLVLRTDLKINHFPVSLKSTLFDTREIDRTKRLLLDNESLGTRSLHLVSALLGHADVATTFGSYIHVLDWVQAALSRHILALPELNAKQWQSLAKLKKSTAYKHIDLKPDAAEIFKVQLVECTAKWGKPFKIETSEKKPAAFKVKASRSSEPWLPSWGEAVKRYQRVCKLNKETPRMIPSGVESVYAQQFYERARSCKGRQMMFLKRVIVEFANKYNDHDGGIVLIDFEEARDFNKFIKLLKFGRENVYGRHFSLKGQEQGKARRYLSKWCKALDLSTNQIESMRRKAIEANRGEFFIKICKSPLVDGVQTAPVASSAFRFFLVLAAAQIETRPAVSDLDHNHNPEDK